METNESKQKYDKECVFSKKESCRALNDSVPPTHCDGCRFFKSVDEYNLKERGDGCGHISWEVIRK